MSWRMAKILDEWDDYQWHLLRLRHALVGWYPNKDGEGYWPTLSHAFINARVELRRSFAYTLGHLPSGWMVGLLAGYLIWGLN